MSKVILTTFLLPFYFIANSQQNLIHDWVKQIMTRSSPHSVWSMSTTMDAANNIYTTGMFSGTIDFDPGPGVFNMTATSSGEEDKFTLDAFMTKFDSKGNFIWAKHWGSKSDDQGKRIAFSNVTNEIYIIGNCGKEADLDPGGQQVKVTEADGSFNFFISKFDINGNLKWTHAFNTHGLASNYSVSLDKSGNVYASSTKWDEKFKPKNKPEIQLDGPNFIVKYDNLGFFQWIVGIKSTINKIAADFPENVYATGLFKGMEDFNPSINQQQKLTASGKNDVFILKLNHFGDFTWVKKIGGTAEDMGFAITVDEQSNVFTTGIFNNAVNFNPNPGTPQSLFSNGGSDIFISKLNTDGNFIWAKKLGGLGLDIPKDIQVDEEKNVYTTGIFSGLADFNPKDGFNIFSLTSNGESDIFISKLNANGDFAFAKQIGGSNGEEVVTSMSVVNKIISITGNSSGDVDFDPNAGVKNLSNSGLVNRSIYIARYKQRGDTPNPFPEPEEINVFDNKNSIAYKVYPNPAHDFWQISFEKEIENYTYTLFTKLGVKVTNGVFSGKNLKLPAGNLLKGEYFLHIETNNARSVIKLIKE